MKTGFAESLFSVGRRNEALALLDTVLAEDLLAYQHAGSNLEEKAIYGGAVIERLTRRIEFNSLRGRPGLIVEDLSSLRHLMVEQFEGEYPGLEDLTTQLAELLMTLAEALIVGGDLEPALTDYEQARDMFLDQMFSLPREVRRIDERLWKAAILRADTVGGTSGNAAAIKVLSTVINRMFESNQIGIGLGKIRSELVLRYQQQAIDFATATDFETAIDAIARAKTAAHRNSGFVYPDQYETKNVQAAVLLDWAKWLESSNQFEQAFDKVTEAAKFHPRDPNLQEELRIYRLRICETIVANTDDRTCLGELALAELAPPPPPPENLFPAGTNYEHVRVFYGTNRAPKGGKFKTTVSDQLHYGWAHVTVPKNRTPGKIPKPIPGGLRPRTANISF